MFQLHDLIVFTAELEFLHVFDVMNIFNPLMDALKPQNNGPLYSNTVIGTLAVDGWAVMFGTAMRGLGGLGPRPDPFSLYQT